MKSGPFSPYEKNVQSQNGEDGVLEEIFRRLNVQRGLCIEFGAWDGKHLSNTWNLWHNCGWEAVLIEGDPARFSVLQADTKAFRLVHSLCAFVRCEGDDRLESLLKRLGITRRPDLLSIDIDGDDYHVLQSLEAVSPRVVVIEHNPTVPAHLELVQHPGAYFGSSALAIARLGARKGYRLAHVTATNLILVHESDFGALGIDEPELGDVFNPSHLVWVMTGFDGTAFLSAKLPYRPDLPDLRGILRSLFGWRSMLRVFLGRSKPWDLPSKKRAFRNPEEAIPVEIHQRPEE